MAASKTIMKTLASVGTILIAAMMGVAGMAFAPAGAPASSTPVVIERDATSSLYATYCAKCHGADGKAGTAQGKSTGAQDFTSARWKSRTSVDDAAATIRDGYQDMPSYKKRLTAAQIQSLAQYTKSFPH